MGVNCSSNNNPSYVLHDIKDVLNFKIVILGDSGSGKTSVFKRYAKNCFESTYRPTRVPQVENVFRKVNVPDDLVASVTLWDLPGKEDMDMRESYYRNVDAAIVVVDLSEKESIDLAGSWKQSFVNKVSKAYTVTEVMSNGTMTTTMERSPCDTLSIPVLLLGNKYDLIEQENREKYLKRMFEKPVWDDVEAIADSNDDVIDPVIPDHERQGIKSSDDHESLDVNIQRKSSLVSDLDEKPDCVISLEAIADKYGFVGSIVASARESDGSVDTAVQSLLRHLLAKSRPAKLKSETIIHNKLTPKKKKKIANQELKYVTYCGIQEMDEVFRQCFAPVKRADDFENYCNQVLAHFKQFCLNEGFLLRTRGNLEECIIGIKNALQKASHKILKEKNDEEFLQLYYEELPNVDIPEEINLAIDLFNKEYGRLCKMALKECPLLDAVLVKLNEALVTMASRLQAKYGAQADRYIDICDKNRTKIEHAKKQILQLVKNVEDNQFKIQSALIS